MSKPVLSKVRGWLLLGGVGMLAALPGCNCADPFSVGLTSCRDAGDCGPRSGTVCCDGFCRSSCGLEADGGADAGLECTPGTCPNGCCNNGVCGAGTTSSACGVGGTACTACEPGDRCFGQQCVARLSDGADCDAGVQCASNKCVDAVCCNTSCTGACEACNLAGSPGRCTLLSIAAPGDPACAPFACNGREGTCPAKCTTTQQCATGFFCNGMDGGTCVSRRDAGEPCQGGTDCATGFCADGVCCDQACAADCDRCDLPAKLGQCLPTGNSAMGSSPCPGGVMCSATSVDCPIPCPCDAGYWCNPASLCASKRADGQPCTANVQCANGHCVDGMCCDSACDVSTCDVCSIATGAAKDGVCSFLGSDHVCRASASACDVEERCNNTASCPADVFAPPSTVCQAAAYGPTSPCVGAGECWLDGMQSREEKHYACNATGSCLSNSTTVPMVCHQNPSGQRCGPAQDGGCRYSGPGDCVGTLMGSGSACSSAGTCDPLPAGDPTACINSRNGFVCADAGFVCNYTSNYSCGGGSDTTTHVCNGGVCWAATSSDPADPKCQVARNGNQCTMIGYTCSYSDTCDNVGDSLNDRCTSGLCGQSVVLNDPRCTRNTNNRSCGLGMKCASSACVCDPSSCALARAGPSCCTATACLKGTFAASCGDNGDACSVCTGITPGCCSMMATGTHCGLSACGGFGDGG